ncbi:DUF4203 domain-containing protein [Georgenia sunbinii]|uniref:DUF4203 domain-containing protein n=1 Tax=Georgenia sunbinii TaxID=3117728 RepID=UPI002F26C79A
MTDVVVGVLALVIGMLLCFRGRGAMRVLLALWGAFVGFGLGAVLVVALTDQGYLATALGWVAAIVLALVFAALAYLFFAVAVVLGFASMGFVLGQTLAAALGASEPWLLTGVGVAGGVVLGLLAVATNLPELVLVVVSALTGAGVAVGGLLLLLDALDLDALAQTPLRIADQPVWYVGQLVLAVVGIVVQLSAARRRRLSTVRDSWAAAGR